MVHRLGALATLVAVLAALALAPSAMAAPGADLTLTKAGRPDPVTPGQYVTYTMSVSNHGPDPASNVVVTDTLPAHTSFVSASHECAFASGTVTCNLGTLGNGARSRLEYAVQTAFDHHAPLTSTATVTSATADPNPGDDDVTTTVHVLTGSHDHLLPVDKAEEQVDFDPGQSRTATITCPQPGETMSDASLRIDHVDQDTGTLRSVVVTEQRTVAPGAYEVTATNTATGRAQTKLYALCIRPQTEDNQGHRHAIVVSDPPVTATLAGVAGRNELTAACPFADQVAIAPGYALSGAAAGEWVTSEPVDDATWRFAFELSSPGQIDVSIRCLDRRLATAAGHTHELWLSHPDRVMSIAPGPATEETVDCSDQAKGIVATFDLGPGLHLLGHDPRPKTRAYRLLNDGPGPADAHLDLLCLGDRVGPDPPPPAGPRAINRSASVSRTGASVPVRVTCPRSGCAGTVTLYAPSKPGSSHAGRRAVGAADFVSRRAGGTTVRVTIAKPYRAAIRTHRLRSVLAEVRRLDGKLATKRTIALRVRRG